jgi:hypothetical protein
VVTFAQALELAAGLDARGWAVVALVVLLAVLRVAAWVARVRRWRRRRALARVPAWGYELPWADGSGVAYVGITTRTPRAGVLPRWLDEGHHAQRHDVDPGRAVVIPFGSLAAARRWERARIRELCRDRRLLNRAGNPRLRRAA